MKKISYDTRNTTFQAVCDGCGKLHGQMFETPRLCAKIAFSRGWFVENHNIYCPGCVEYDPETDWYKPKKKENGNGTEDRRNI